MLSRQSSYLFDGGNVLTVDCPVLVIDAGGDKPGNAEDHGCDRVNNGVLDLVHGEASIPNLNIKVVRRAGR